MYLIRYLLSKVLILILIIPILPFALVRKVGDLMVISAEWCVNERKWAHGLANWIENISDWGEKKV